jgi:hypothetical protein
MKPVWSKGGRSEIKFSDWGTVAVRSACIGEHLKCMMRGGE